MTAILPPRSEVDPAATWNIEALFATPERWDAELGAVRADLAVLPTFAGRLADVKATRDYLAAWQALSSRAQKLNVYAGMAASVDAADTEAAARRDRASALLGELATASAFAEPEWLALPPGTLAAWTAGDLADSRVFFERLERSRPHVRSAEVEEILGLVRAPFAAARSVHPTLVNSDLDLGTVRAPEGDVRIGHGNVDRLLQRPERDLRRAAWEAYADAHLGVANTMAAGFLAGVRSNVFTARARRYDDALHAALAPNHLPVSVFHTLLDTFDRHVPTWHRYFRARARWLGLEKLREFDVKAPLSPNPPRFSYDEAVELIAAGMAPLGEAYVSRMRAGLTEERWVDHASNLGKRQGAFSTGAPGTSPYIFMSFAGSIFSLSTLAHEIGHSMHSALAWDAQPALYGRYSLFVAEVASNFNQAMVRAHLLQARPEPDFQLALLEEAFSNFHRYFFVMPSLARFELEAHRRVEAGRGFSAPDLNEMMADLLARGYGDAVEIDRARSGVTWGQFSTHIYSNFYTWQYATGIAAAHALLGGFGPDPEGARERYLAFLRAGGAMDPLDALALAGVDMRSPEPVERAFAVLASLVDRFEALVEARG